ncbi:MULTISPECIES: hypothetical protein [Pseudomonas]|uniref:N-acetyltransferase domain-containing protein n=1 Tax=Pseudomonas fluorescens TaxID=294 RepID=A0A0N9W4I2_PSEFL|nr:MULTISPECIES: hypothetical protein [Pseudomonas]ALI08315.1 hypothetical protein AO356_16325 [Pseudomonas fluorescens]
MNVTVRKALSSDMYPVCKLLRESTLNSNWIGVNVRKRMFADIWSGGEDYFGYVMLDGDVVVGFLGLLFTTQPCNGQQRFCELHSWYVQVEYRKESLKLLLPVLSMRKVTLLNYTPTPDVYEISKKFGFIDLETELVLMYPFPNPLKIRRRYRLETDIHRVAGWLSEQESVVFRDHAGVECRHLMIVDSVTGESCYLIVKRMTRRWFEPIGRVLFIGNPQLFARSLDSWRLSLCLQMRVQCLVSNAAELAGYPLSGVRLIKREVPSLVKPASGSLANAPIKPLYSLPLLIGYKLH